MIIITKSFSADGKIDISHLSSGAQKRIIKQERKKIELDQKIADTEDSLRASKSRSAMSLEDNAKLGAYELKKNPVASIASGAAGFTLGGKIGQEAAALAAKVGAPGLAEPLGYVGRVGGSMIGSAISEFTGKTIGAIKGLTANRAVKKKERKLNRLLKKRQDLE